MTIAEAYAELMANPGQPAGVAELLGHDADELLAVVREHTVDFLQALIVALAALDLDRSEALWFTQGIIGFQAGVLWARSEDS